MCNSYSIEKLKKIINIKSINNINEEEVFDYLRIISIHDKKEEKEASNILFFPITLDGEYISNSWIIEPVLLGEKVNDIIDNNPNYAFVLETNMVNNLNNKNVRYIEVESIDDTIESIYEYALGKSKAKTIAVTGSTGKTTMAGLIEHVLANKYKVLRVYSKRITPIILKAYIINLLTADIDYVILEMSLYYKNHVKTLANILPPYISAIINLDNSHLGNDGMNRREDLAISKAQIFEHAKIGYVDKDNDILGRMYLKNKKIYLDNEIVCNTSLQNLKSIERDKVVVNGNDFQINNTRIKAYLLSELSKTQISLAYSIANNLGLAHEEICNSISSYQPVENRINKQSLMNREIIFDGDVTNSARIRSLANSLYKNKVLVIRKFGSSENFVNCNDVIDSFNKFDKVYLFNDIEYFKELVHHSKVKVVDSHNFVSEIGEDTTIIYHYSAYFRSYDIFNENNLHTIDKTLYPILYDEKVGV